MPFKTNAFTVMEYYNMDLIICIEYENINDSTDKYLKVIINREYDGEMINTFKMDENISKELLEIYEYSKTVSKIEKKDDTYVVCGQRINKKDFSYKNILFNNNNPVQNKNIDINFKSQDINDEVSEYYNRVLKTIHWRCQEVR